MGAIIYSLCALTAFGCAWLLLRNYSQTQSRLILWSGLCFVGLFLNNLLLVVDRVILPDVDLSVARLVPALIGMMLLLYGLIWEDK
jgi:hypothetical protein